MSRFKLTPQVGAAFIAGAMILGACSSTSTPTTPGTPAFVVYGSGAPVSGASIMGGGDGDSNAVFGPAASITLKLYAMYISTNADCSSPILVQDLGSAGEDKNFMDNPVLFSGTPAAGTYHCVMLDMSDMLHMTPGANIGSCVTGHDYSGDIYHDGETDWKDVNMGALTGTGTNEVPHADRVTIFITSNPSAAIARGTSENQTIGLSANLIVPGQTTFHVDASSAVASNGVDCGLNPPHFAFQ